jgi:hypothetical protein
MKLFFPKSKPRDIEEWHALYPIWPRRIGDHLVFFEKIERRRVVVNEGNWGGGYEYVWEYRF